MEKVDIVVIGAGSGGCATAIRAADLGLKVVIIEERKKDGPGGTCINRGCIPTKVLVKASGLLGDIKKAQAYGIDVEGAKPNFKKIMANKNKIVSQMAFGLKSFILGSRKIPVIYGTAKILSSNCVQVTDGDKVTEYSCNNVMIATGSEPAMIPAFNIDRKNVITSDEALTLTEVPKSMLVIGAGAVGIEMSVFYNSMGTEVTIVEALDNVAQALCDEEMSNMVKSQLEKKGIKVMCGVAIDKVEVLEDGSVASHLNNGEVVNTEKVLVSIGRKTNLDNLGLEELGVNVERGKIITDKRMMTNVENIYAVGDVTNGPQLSHKAQNEGVTAAEVIYGNNVELDYDVLPWVIFSKPEIAKVGLSEKEAADKGIETITGQLAMAFNEKATCSGDTDGAIKLVADKNTHQLLGGIIISAEASSLIGEVAIAVKKKATVDEIASTIHAHPTMTEAIMEAAKSAIGKEYHKQIKK